jgi:hypothetical protein
LMHSAEDETTTAACLSLITEAAGASTSFSPLPCAYFATT